MEGRLIEEEGKEAEDRGEPDGERRLKDVKSTMWMIMTCSQKGSVTATPLKSILQQKK